MTAPTDNRTEREEPLRRAVLAMRQMRGRLETLEAEHAGPIAVVGIGCRYPGGVKDPDSFWDLIVSGRDAVSEVPADRWDSKAFFDPDPEAVGRMYTTQGGFIDEPCRNFDAGFFGISPREAVGTDPQHRLLLEVSWEALENAGLSAERLTGSRTGVFVGISTADYAQLRFSTGGFGAIDPYLVLGASASFAAGRLAYTFGFQGPVVPVDTACSSSLVAAHLAMQALRRDECDMALVGGVNLILSPMLTIYFCKLRALSVNGRCRAFDAGADGYVRGEGCGMLVLKRLEDAQSNGDRILAVLRGSSVNHDGRSSGITVPNGPSQQSMIRRALQESGIDPAHVGYVEAHGTGTQLGDPIEMQALAATYGKAKREDGPLVIGSVKTQIGHLEAAAGVAGLSRVILALQHRKMPAHLHFETLNPHIESTLAGHFDYRLPRVGEEWSHPGRPRAAAVSSFGINGTNVHIVLEEAPEPPARKPLQRDSELLVLSAKSEAALKELAQRYRQFVADTPALPLADVCHTAAVGRVHFQQRIAFCGGSGIEIAEQIDRWLRQGAKPRAQEAESRLAMLFPDTATELERVASGLANRFPVFAKALEECPAAPRNHALQYALLRLWQSYGLRPQLVVGQGIGLAVAAVVAEVLSPEEGALLARMLEAGEPVPTDLHWRRARIEWRDASSGKIVDDAAAVNWTIPAVGPTLTPKGFLGLRMEVEPGQGADLFIARTLERLYNAGITPDWMGAEPGERFQRQVLPTYPFQRQTFWGADMPIAPGTKAASEATVELKVLRPVWNPAPIVEGMRPERVQLLVADGPLAKVAADCFLTLEIATEVLRYAGCDADGQALAIVGGTDEALPLAGLLHAPLIDIRFLDPGTIYRVSDLLPVLQALPDRDASYCLATCRAFAVHPEEGADPAQAALWGMALSLRAEQPELSMALVDLDKAEPALLVREFLAGLDPKPPVAWRLGERFMRQTEPVAQAFAKLSLRDDASYLVTGGFGGVGQQLIRWLAKQGARHIVVPSRRGAEDPRAAALANLRAELTVFPCDLTDGDALARMLSEIEPPLAGIFHVAGVTEDALITRLTPASLARVMAAKVGVALALDEQTRKLPLEHFVLFSSMAGVLGSAGQANYAAANAALQSLAYRRRALGRPALCIDWGLWDGPGMAAALSDQDRARLARQGVRPMPPTAALSALGMAMAGTEVELMIGLFDEFPAPSVDRTPNWSSRIAAATGAARSALVGQCLNACVAQVLDMPVDQIKPGDDLFDLGFDSLMIMDLVKLLKQALGCALYPREFYQTPIVGQLAGYLTTVLSDTTPTARPAGPVATPWSPAQLEETALGDPVPDTGFILSAPRSGSTLLRVMLAGHSRLFVPPELHLLPFADMAERADALAGSHLDEGMVRALMALRGCSAEQAKAEVDAMIEQRRPIQEVYRLLSIAAQGRQVIDKSPSYAANIETLRRAERLCNKPRYIHLVRHPYAMIESFTRLRMDRLIGVQGADPFDMAETIWCDMTNNIFELTRSLSEDRDLLVTYEDLVREPQVQIRRITRFLGVDYDPALLDPYSGERMTDGISDRSLSVGDPNFTSRTAIDPVLAEAWRKVELPRDLREETAELARELGYEIPVRRRRSPVQALQMREELVSGFGLELTVCRWGDVLAPAVVCIHGMLEQGSIFAPLAGELVRSGLQVIAPDLRGHGKSDHCAASASYQMADFVADLDAVVSRLESGPVILMGLSLGAAISTLYAAARPERVRDLILVEPPLTRRREPQEVAKILRAQLDESSRRTVDTSLPDFETAIERLLAVYPGMDRALARALAERGTETTLNGSRWRWDWHLRTPAGVGSAAGQEELLGQLQVPHRLVFGRQGDLIQGCDWRAVCNGNLRDIIVLPGGHHLHVEAPEALARLVTDSERWRANEQNQQRNVS